MELWHGSEVVVEHPSLDKCRQFNDYGRGMALPIDMSLI